MLKKVTKVFLLFGELLLSLICVSCDQSTTKVSNVNASYIGTYFMGFDYFNRFDILENSKDLEILLKMILLISITILFLKENLF